MDKPAFDDLSDQGKIVYHQIEASRGNLDGPFLYWLHSPDMAQRAAALGEICRLHNSLDFSAGRRKPHKTLSELAILINAKFWRCQTEWDIHCPIARREKLREDVINAIAHDQTPQFNAHEADQQVLYRFVHELNHNHFISKQTRQDAQAQFTPRQLADLTALCGYYTLVAMTLNVFEDAPLVTTQKSGQSAP